MLEGRRTNTSHAPLGGRIVMHPIWVNNDRPCGGVGSVHAEHLVHETLLRAKCAGRGAMAHWHATSMLWLVVPGARAILLGDS